jgi:3-oxoacyl-[acyl-carrier protein] reductase
MTRSALITGVGRRRGIGAGIAAGLAADSWDLALSYWRPYDERLHMESNPDDPDYLATELRALGSKVELLRRTSKNRVRQTHSCRRPLKYLGRLMPW